MILRHDISIVLDVNTFTKFALELGIGRGGVIQM
jgi:hypothetical protein